MEHNPSASASTGRLPRHSDGGGTLTASTHGGSTTPTRSGSKKGSRRRKGLNTISAPLTPLAGVSSPTHQQQQQQHYQQQQHGSRQSGSSGSSSSTSNKPPAATSVTPSRLGRRNTQSDAGGAPQHHQHTQQQQLLFTQHSVSEGQEYSSSSASKTAGQQVPGNNTACSSREFVGLTPEPGAGGKVVKQLQWQHQQPSQQQQQQQHPQQQQQQQILAGPPPPAAPPALPQGPFSTGASGSTAAAAAASAAASAPPPRATLQHAASLEGPFLDPPPTLWEFFYAEATPHEKYPTADVLWRQTERDRVYNFLLYVPYQLERIMIFGTMLCVYSFLGALTALPLRCLWALLRLLTNLLLPSSRRQQRGGGSNNNNSSRPSLLPGAQLYDLLCVLLMVGAVFVLAHIKPAVLYYWMKDITSEFLKIQVLFTALEICDKILSNFGVDVLEALSSTCTLYTQSSIGLMQLLSDLFVAFLLITAHGSVLMCQAMVFAVTMNSKRNALLALMIATNFVELKGQVYKRTDTNKLWALACQDIVERFQLLLVLCFVVVEDISNSGTWWPASGTLWECGRIFLWEIVIDISKHAVLGKFNDIRPGIYKEYMRDLCSDSLDKHSHNTHKLVGFCPLGPAALSLRMVHTLFTLKCDGRPDWQLRCAVLLASWMAACATQVVLGYSLKWLAYLYVRHHALQAGGKLLPRAINVTPSGIKLLAQSGAPPTAVSTAVKASAGAAAAAGGGGTATQPAGVGGGMPGFSPKGMQAIAPLQQMQSRTVGIGSGASTAAAAAVSGGSPLAGSSPAPSPKGSSSALWPLSGQLPPAIGAAAAAFNNNSAIGSQQFVPAAATAGMQQQQQGFPPNNSMQQLAALSAGIAAASGCTQQQQLQPCVGVAAVPAASSSSSFSSVNGMTTPAMLAAALATNSAPPGVALGPAAVAASAAAGSSSNNSDPAAQAQLQLMQDLGLVSTSDLPASLQQLKLPVSGSLAAIRAASGVAGVAGAGPNSSNSRPDSPFSNSSHQLQPFADRLVDARKSFSDARAGWDHHAGDGGLMSCSFDTAGVAGAGSGGGSGTTLADAMFASKEAPAAVSAGPDTVGVVVASSSGAAAAAASKGGDDPLSAAQAHSSSYSGVSASGLVGRGVQKSVSMTDTSRAALTGQQQSQQVHQHSQKQREQEWQQPKSRHRAKRE